MNPRFFLLLALPALLYGCGVPKQKERSTILLMIDTPALFQQQSAGIVDSTLLKVIEATRQEGMNSAEPTIRIFSRHFDRIARPIGRSLGDYYVLSGSPTGRDQDVLEELARLIDSTVQITATTERSRLEAAGFSLVNATMDSDRRLRLEIEGEDPGKGKEIAALLETGGNIEFTLVQNNAATVSLLRNLNDQLFAELYPDSAQTPDSITTAAEPYRGLPEEEAVRLYNRDHPLVGEIVVYLRDADDNTEEATGVWVADRSNILQGDYSFLVQRINLKSIQDYLRRESLQRAIANQTILFSARSEIGEENSAEGGFYGLYFLKREPEMTAENIIDAQADLDAETELPVVNFTLDGSGTNLWESITRSSINSRIALVMDSSVYSAPIITQTVIGGNVQLTGIRDMNEAVRLATILRSGRLPVPVRVMSMKKLDAT